MDGTGGLQEFCNTIAGVWSNKKQAQSDPTGYVWSYIQWDLLGDSRLKSKQWYKNDGSNSTLESTIIAETPDDAKSSFIASNPNASIDKILTTVPAK